jgi:hypothetical protein
VRGDASLGKGRLSLAGHAECARSRSKRCYRRRSLSRSIPGGTLAR